jgi:pilus assembly protein CpaE
VLAADGALRDEMEAALRGLRQSPPAYFASDLREALQAAASRDPQWIVLELGTDVRLLRTAAQELALAAPSASLVAAWNDEPLASDVASSAPLIEAVRCGVRDFLRRPISSTELDDLLQRLDRAGPRTAVPPGTARGGLYAFISNKGGVGKSTLAVNAACALARRHPQRVLLVDASLQLGVCAAMLDLQPRTTLADAAAERDRLDTTLLRQLASAHRCGLDLLAAPPDAVAAARIDDELLARVLTLARRCYDYVVVDTFPVLDRLVTTLLDAVDRAYVVMDNLVPTLLGAARLLTLLAELGLSPQRIRLVLNRYRRGAGRLSRIDAANYLQRPIDLLVPSSERLVQSVNTGQPYALSAGRWRALGRALQRLADDLEQAASAGASPGS